MAELIQSDPGVTGPSSRALPPARAHVLLVDDQPARLLTYEAILAGLDIQCERALSGAEALQKLLRQEFAVVLLDVQMPDIDGFEVARMVREHPRLERMPIIFVTGERITALDQMRGYEVGAIDYIPIPVVPEILRSKVAMLVELHQRRGELRALNAELTQARHRLEAEHSRALADKEAQLRAVFEHPDQLTVVLEAERDAQGQIRDWIYREANSNALQLLNRSREDLLGQRMSSVFDAQRHARLSALCARVLTSREHVKYEAVFGTRDFLVTVFPIGDDRVVSAGLDVTAQKSAQAAQREIERTFQALVENAPIGVAHNAMDGRFVYVNEGFCRLVGYSAEELRAMTWQQITHPEDLELDLRTAGFLDERGHHHYTIEKRYVRKDGSTVWVSLHGNFVKDDQGRPLFGVACAVDISERREKQAALELADRRKDEFLAMLAHELRNPVAPILSVAEALSRLLARDDKLRALVRIVQRQGMHLSRLLDDLLDVARITQGRIELRLEPLTLAACVEAAQEGVEPQLRAKRQQLRLVQDPDVPPLLGDRVRLAQCIGNLLSNASKYSEEGTAISLRTRRDGDHAVLEVQDQGCGIDPDFLPHVFELFAQSTRSIDRSLGGLGIGLCVCRKLIELHGGRIQAASDGPGKGSVFTIRLPAARASLPETPAPITSTGAPMRVLIIDDNNDAADSMAMLLQIEGHEVDTAYSAEDGLAKVASFDPNVVLLDIGLPHMDGCEVARRMRAQGVRARLIAVTGYGEEKDRKRAVEAGFHAHLAKPVDFAVLGEMLRQA
jgi:PAS domain S-box-containing protein